MKKLASKLNNFRLTAIVVAAIQVLGILATVGNLLSYLFAGGIEDKKTVTALGYIKGQPERQIYGMIFFLACIITIGVGILVIYNLFPNILNKEKVETKKGFVITGMANSIVHVIIIVFVCIILKLDDPQTTGGFIAGLVGSVLFIAANALMIYPLVRCEFYQPDVIAKK